MFVWYRQASVCYVYMSDVACTSQRFGSKEFRDSRWFTRGSTLQELLAPTFLLFLNQSWQELGSRSSLALDVEKATGITSSNSINLEACSIATRMSWAASRSTTRIEDQAYSLLGLFGINMPLLYGEGNNAFLRLQLEIVRGSDDDSIFAWNNPLENPGSALFARSPSCFRSSGQIESADGDAPEDRSEFAMTNRGLRTSVRLYLYDGTVDHLYHGHWNREGEFARSVYSPKYKERVLQSEVEAKEMVRTLRLWPLRCRSTQTRQRLAISLLEEPDGRFIRNQWLRLGEFPSSVYPGSNWKALPIQSIYVRDSSKDNSPVLDTRPCTLALTFLVPHDIRLGTLDFPAVDFNKLQIYGPLMVKSSGFFLGQTGINFVPLQSTVKNERGSYLQHIDTVFETEHSSAIRFLQIRGSQSHHFLHPITCVLLLCLLNRSPVIGLFQYRGSHDRGSISQLENFLVDIVIRCQDPQRLKDTASISIRRHDWNLVAKCKPLPFPKERTDSGSAAYITLSVDRGETYELMSSTLRSSRSGSFNSAEVKEIAQTEPDVDRNNLGNERSAWKKSRFLGGLRDRLRARS